MKKVRVVVPGNIAFYTTPAMIKRGVGDHVAFNEAVRQGYKSLLKFNRESEKAGGVTATGQSGSWNGFTLQIDIFNWKELYE